MKDVLALILAGGRVDAMSVLTARRSMAAVPFGGMYRIVDFVLTNLAEAGISRTGILSQYRPASLMDHVGIGRPWDFNGRTRELTFLPPYQGTKDVDWYRGTADAVYQNLHVIERYKPRDVLVLAADHVYRMDYAPIVDFHRRRGADATVVFKRMDCGRPSRFGVGVMNAHSRVVEYHEKPADPPSDLASLTIYVFRTEALVARLKENADTGRTFHIYDEVLPGMVAEGRVAGWVHDGPWEYLRPLGAYFDAHMRLLRDPEARSVLQGVLTNIDAQGIGEAAPAVFADDGDAKRSLVSPGARIAGRVADGVLFPFVHVDADASVSESVLLHGVTVGRGATLSRAVVDKDVAIGEGATLEGGDRLVAVGKSARIGRGARLLPGAVVGVGEVVPDGAVVGGEGTP
jgi:glucose-1-phosphate adenylyltransferase